MTAAPFSFSATGDVVDVYVNVDGTDIAVIKNIDRDLLYRFSGVARAQMKKRSQTSFRDSFMSETANEPVILACTARAFPGVAAFRPIVTWMLANEPASPSIDVRDLKQLLPPPHTCIPLEALVCVYAAARMLEIPEPKPLLSQVYISITSGCDNADDIRFVVEKLGYHEGCMARVANTYLTHLYNQAIAVPSEAVQAVLSEASQLDAVFQKIKRFRAERKIHLKLESGDAFEEDVPYLIF